MAAGPEALHRPDPRHAQAAPARGKCGAAGVELSAYELTEIKDAASKIQVQGGRYSEGAERMTNL
jgi:hypothetical protein